MSYPATLGEPVRAPDGSEVAWRVEPAQADNPAMDRTKTAADGQRWRLVHRTLPDDSAFEFTAGIGVTAYHYAHHGTTCVVDLELDRFMPGR